MSTKLQKNREVRHIYKEKLCGLAVPTHRVLSLEETQGLNNRIITSSCQH